MLNTFDDIHLPHEFMMDIDQILIDRIVKFFRSESELIYPAKSYFVAIIYAYLMTQYFNEDFYDILSNQNLLPDDIYFIPYGTNPYTTHIYDEVLKDICPNGLDDIMTYSSIEKTKNYFLQEFLLEENAWS
jgi:hypothetical protein